MDKRPTVRFLGSEIIGVKNVPHPRPTENEIRVLQLLRQGEATARKLVVASAGEFKHASIRKALDGLAARDLVSSTLRGDTRWYRAAEQGARIAEAEHLLDELALALARSAARRDIERERQDRQRQDL